MKKFMSKHLTEDQIQNVISGLILVIIVTVGYFLFTLTKDVRSLKSELASTTSNFSNKILALESGLNNTSLTSQTLSQQLAEQQNKSEDLNNTLSDISSTVGTLEKLSKTDRELLQKYSKVYFLNENYVPMRLSEIDSQYLYNKDKKAEFHSSVLSYLTDMLDAAADSNAKTLVASAYRSFGTQGSLKSSYLVYYGSGANKFSSDQGYSEHQLGTAVDLSTPFSDTYLQTNYENTQSFNWLKDNAYKYGFILSYPKNNSYYQYEPWHWRFVGVRLAKYLHKQNKNFYDLDQRTIDTYLADIFD